MASGYPDWSYPIIWATQEGELWPISEWVAKQGQQKLWFYEASIAGGASDTELIYTVPAGKKIYLIRYWGSQEQPTTTRIYYTTPTVTLFRGYTAQGVPALLPMGPPIVIEAGKNLYLYLFNRGASAMTANATLAAFELDA